MKLGDLPKTDEPNCLLAVIITAVLMQLLL